MNQKTGGHQKPSMLWIGSPILLNHSKALPLTVGAILHLDPVTVICYPDSPTVGLSWFQNAVGNFVTEHVFHTTGGVDTPPFKLIDL